ncbi:transposase [Oceanispirochaeta crateris]|uniref:Transposase n=1 Tax=Oceanispirochaeta crateris TaxID=2518645 RepID=A0A5C1QSQ2_9SPIO|nr:transposase [Oceanispirochaeta crateris]QEN09626.1 transposase [Oceanispirochaeta crateris]
MNEKKRRRYDAEFKRNAIALSEEPGRTAHSVEQSLGIANGLIGNWKRQLSTNGNLAFPGNGIEALTPDQRKIRDLEKQLYDAEMDRDILKKALAIFSKTPK